MLPDDLTVTDPRSALKNFVSKEKNKIPRSKFKTSNSGSCASTLGVRASATKLPAKALKVVPSVIKQMQMKNLQQYIDLVGGSLSTNHVSGKSHSVEQQQNNFPQNTGSGLNFLDKTGEFLFV